MRRSPTSRSIGLAALVIGAPVLSAAQPQPARSVSRVPDSPVALAPAFRELLDPVRAHAASLVANDSVPSLVIMAAVRGRVVWAEGMGWADREARVGATVATPYRVASVTKAMTATVAMQLAQRGALDLDAPVARYLSEPLRAPRGGREAVTVRRLLDMTAGIPHYWQFVPLADREREPTPAEQVARYATVAWTPGRVIAYSNLSYGVAAEAIAGAAGRPFPDVMRELLFAPLGMRSSRVATNARSVGGTAVGYDAARRRLASFGFSPPGGAGVIASAADLMRFALFHLGHGPDGTRASSLDTAHLAALHRTPRPGAPNVYDAHRAYTSGWGIIEYGTPHEVLLSNGAVEGSAASVLIAPRADVAIVVLTNLSNGPADELAFDIAGRLVPGFAPALANAMRVADSVDASRPLTADTSLTGRWTGFVHVPAGPGRFDSIAVVLDVDSLGSVTARVGAAPAVKVTDPRLESGFVMGSVAASLPAQGELREASLLDLELRHEGDALIGVLRAIRQAPIGAGFGIPLFAELRRR